MNKKLSVSLVSLAALAALTFSACSGGDANAEQQGKTEDGLREVKVVAVPVVDVGALLVGTDQGFFEEEGLELDIEYGQGTAAMIPALLNGQYDIQYGGTPNLLQSVDSGLPLEAIALGDRSTGEWGADHGGLVVPEDSSIESPADLEGHTVAANALRGLHEIAVKGSVARDGGDPSKVTFVEMALPDMGAALEKGEIDAASTSEPFLGTLLAEDNRLVTSPFVDIDPDFVAALYFATSERIAEDPELFDAFVRALHKSYEYIDENPQDLRDSLDTFTQIDPETAKTMALSRFTPVELTVEDLKVVAEAAADAGTIEDADKAVEGASGYIKNREND